MGISPDDAAEEFCPSAAPQAGQADDFSTMECEADIAEFSVAGKSLQGEDFFVCDLR